MRRHYIITAVLGAAAAITAVTPSAAASIDQSKFDTVSLYAGGAVSFTAGVAPFAVSGTPVAGDFNGDGVDSVGSYAAGTFRLRTVLDAAGPEDVAFTLPFAEAGDVPVVGDWDGDGRDGVGVFRRGTFLLRDALSAGPAEHVFAFGGAGTPVAGDWDGDGRDGVGVFRGGVFHLRNALSAGPCDATVSHGGIGASDLPVAGDWDGDGRATVGAYRPRTGAVTLLNAAKKTDQSYLSGTTGAQPLVGDFSLDDTDPTPAQLAQVYGFYADPANHATQWVAANPTDPRAAPIRTAVVGKPGAHWFGNWSGDIRAATDAYVTDALAVHKVPMLVAYNIPDRDCGGASGGGAGSPEAYREWIDAFAAGVADRPAIVIIEPDSLAQAYDGCIPDPAALQTRFDLIKYAIAAFGGDAWTYADGGNATWWSPEVMAERLDRAGVAAARGVAVNVSNFHTTPLSTTYGDGIEALTGKPYLIDTSRNGNGGTAGVWCNPPGAKLGAPSRWSATGAEFQVWVKVVGDSDGPCGTGEGIPAGTFSPDLAIHLINGS